MSFQLELIPGSIKRFILLAAALIIFIEVENVRAAEKNHSGIYFSMELGREELRYHEDSPDVGITSRAKSSNTLITFLYQKQFGQLSVGLSCRLPVVKGSGNEEWNVLGRRRQTNTFTYSWQRSEAFLEYQVKPWLITNIGFCWSKTYQKRYDIVIYGEQNTLTAVENGHFLESLAGIQGKIPCNNWLSITYGLFILQSISSRVDNSELPGIVAKDMDGKTVKANFGLQLELTPSFTLSLKTERGRRYLEASQWLEYEQRRRVQFPDNHTDFYITSLTSSLYF